MCTRNEPALCRHNHTQWMGNIYQHCEDCGAVRHRDDTGWHTCRWCIRSGYALPTEVGRPGPRGRAARGQLVLGLEVAG